MGQLRLLGEPSASDDHAALANLAFPQACHTGFVASAGLAGGQAIIGGTAAGENLSLQSTAHAARGVVEAIDALRLTSGLIQDSGGNPRIALATSSPYLTLIGDVRVAPAAGDTLGRLALGPSAIDPNVWLNMLGSTGTGGGTWTGIQCQPMRIVPSGQIATMYALAGQPGLNVQSGGQGLAYGLFFAPMVIGAGTVPDFAGIFVNLQNMLFTGTLPQAAAIHIGSPGWFGAAKPTRGYGLTIDPQGAAGITEAVGLLVDAPAGATNNYTIWAGAPITGTPRLRLDAGTSGAGQTMLHLAEGTTPTLRRVQWKLYSALVAGDRVMVLV